jgi:hypothetical protein
MGGVKKEEGRLEEGVSTVEECRARKIVADADFFRYGVSRFHSCVIA